VVGQAASGPQDPVSPSSKEAEVKALSIELAMLPSHADREGGEGMVTLNLEKVAAVVVMEPLDGPG